MTPKPGGLRQGEKVAMPRLRRTAQRAILRRDQVAALRFQREKVAHPDIVQDTLFVPQRADHADQPRGRLVVGIVVAGGDLFAMRRHLHVADVQHRPLAIAHDAGHLGPARLRRGQAGGAAGHETCWHKADEHAVDIGDMHRFARQAVAAFDVREGQHDLRVFGRAGGVVPQPHIPGARRAACIAPLDGQRRTIGRIERDDTHRPPAKAQRGARIIAVRGVGQQRMVERVRAVPDQPGQLAFVIEIAFNPQRIGCGRGDAGHHRARKVHRPVNGIEPLDMVGVLPTFRGRGGGEPVGHCAGLRCLKKRGFSQRARRKGGRRDVVPAAKPLSIRCVGERPVR